MKYLISLILGGFFLASPLIAQNAANNGPRILDQVDVVTNTAEDAATDISSRELFVMENSMNDYSSTIWSREIYRQIAADTEGNETFFYPAKSTDNRVNLFSLLINLISTNTVKAYEYGATPEITDSKALDAKKVLYDNMITPDGESTKYNLENVPSDKISHYLVKERWYFDIKTFKGDVRVTHICPVLLEKGKYYPLFWVAFDDVSVYLARAKSPVAVANVTPVLSNASIFDIIRNRWYRGCIYQVGLRQLSHYFPEMKDLIKERQRIENELDYIQAKFYAAERRR
ncbi:gliding motility protein GldN [Dysgonomonas sp. BGC7]|uniref:type IX secretion system ring protein PorN/GldN n=1 Tax=Dysgonomonas sp. BGC7 TaxID=1658008 RepID=UPI00068211E3|nr:gliding motility protein GldN [Dysgonomonas sp. BGC7]MBD8389928.1 gliding motility protein GldN [Dysgonomonas sp. BGC7]